MGAKVQRLHVRLFVEGVEMPCISATVQCAPNSPIMAAIQIPPLPEGTRLFPRSIVHVFFRDFYGEEDPNLNIKSITATNRPGPTTIEKIETREDEDGRGVDADIEFRPTDAHDFALQRYKLMFVGDLMGFQWTKNSINRSLVLQCADPSNYWDYAYQYNNTDLFGPGYKALFSGGSTNLFTDFLSSPGQIVTQILQTPSTRYPNLRGLLGGLIHLLEAMSGSYYGKKKYAGQNIFFSLAELRLHITQLITAYDKDPTSRKLLGGSYDHLFGRSIGNLGDQASFRKVINKLAGVIFHETFGQPCPYYVPGTEGTISGFSRQKIQNIVGFGPIALTAATAAESLRELRSDMEAANRANNSGAVDRATFVVKSIDDAIQRVATVQKLCKQSARMSEQLAPQARKSGTAQVSKMAQNVSKYFKAADSKLGQAISRMKAKRSRPLSSHSSHVFPLMDSATDYLDKIQTLEANVTPSKQAIPASLKQQIFRPDVWFSAPPRCNVLFPDQYTLLNYQRQFMMEPTRLMLKTHDEFFGEDILFDNFYFAPKGITLKADQAKLRALLRGDILDHELFTGILPVFEKMGEFNIFAARSGVGTGKPAKLGLAQRSTNFLYFKYRFAARQMQIAAKFNPYIACGFPGLVIDKYTDLDTLALHNQLKRQLPDGENYASKLPPLLGTHFLASFTDVTHQCDQSQGTTNITCSYPRQVDETVEFLGVQTEKTELLKKQSGEAVRTTEVAALTAPRVGSQGPNRGKILSVVEVTNKYAGKSFENARKLPLLGVKRDKKTKQLTQTVPVAVPQVAKVFGPVVVELAGDENLVVTFRAWEVTESKSRLRKTQVYLPPEEYIRPGWYGDCWHPANIAQVYYDFFNIGSITEPTQIQNTVTGEGGDPFVSSDAATTLADASAASVNANEDEESPLRVAKDQLIALSQSKEASIQDAVSLLVLTYSVMRNAGFDTEQFIRSYTWRPIATILDMFGSSDLMFDTEGKEVVQGFEGFHSRAFGPYEDLFGLVTPDLESILGIKRHSPQAQKADTRKRKLQAALDYVAALKLSRAILG